MRPEPISIWAPQKIDGELAFVRPDPLPLGDHYATRKVLRPKRSELPLRVAFFGESVAAGYLYAPHLTPAQVLEEQLRAAGGQDNFEVIDLARTNETLASLAATVRASLQIQPDMLVLFVGNNWNLLETPEVSPYAPSTEAKRRYAEALREGLDGPVRLADQALRQAAEGTFELIALIAKTVGIPVIVMVPEVNLADWETRQPVVRLPGDGVARWYGFLTPVPSPIALPSPGRGAPPPAFSPLSRLGGSARGEGGQGGEEMLELDAGTCPTTWRLLGRSQDEVDSARYATMGFLSAPQATTQVKELLRELSRKHGFTLVDLREVLHPDRRFFLDYCHLTLEGIEKAMAAVTAEVVRLSGMPGTGEPLPPVQISPEAEATACFGAAIHSAHRLLSVGPKLEILEHWCEEALRASPGIEEAMLDVLEARCAPLPAVLTAAQQRNLASPYRLLLQHGWRWDHLDAELIEAIVAVLERRGLPVREKVTRLLLQHHLQPGTDLADPFYLWEPLERFYPEAMGARRAFYRSPWPVSSFCLIADGESNIELKLTARLPEGGSGKVEIAVNGAAVGVLPVEERWTKGALHVPAAALHPGLNRLTLRWPNPPPIEGNPFQPVIERLEQGLAADLHPVFGQVFSLIAR